MNDRPQSYTFDWRRSEHARVSTMLVREQFRTGAWRVMKWVVVAIVVLAWLLSIILALLGDVASGLRLLPLLVAVTALLLVFGWLTGSLRAWQVQRQDPNVQYPLTHTVDASGLHVSMHTAEIELKWAGLHQIRETPDMFLFYYSKTTAYFLPKRAVGGEAEVESLREWLRTVAPSGVVVAER